VVTFMLRESGWERETREKGSEAPLDSLFMQRVAVCCRPFVAVCCRVLQCVAM